MTFLFENPLVQRLGWMLLHFIWQGALIALLFWAANIRLRRGSPKHRYLAGCAALFFMAICPVITFLLSAPPTSASPIPINFQEVAPQEQHSSC